MIRHLVWWTLAPEAEGRTAAENANLMKQQLESLRGNIPGLLSIDVAVNFLDSSTLPVQVLLLTTHKNSEDLAAYATHPDHVAIAVNLIKKVTTSRQAIDAVFA